MSRSASAGWLRLLMHAPDADPESDRELLRRFVDAGDRAALESLIFRYAGLVHGVCRRILNDPADVDDAVQAVFLVLTSKPTAVSNPGSLPAWLHGTARRTALKLRSRRRPEAAVDVPTLDADPSWAEVRVAIDTELATLPTKYQGPVVRVLVLEETQQQAAAELGLSLSTLKRRLDAGRACLKRRLERRGIAPLLLLSPLPALDRLGAAQVHKLARPFIENLPHSPTAIQLSQGVLFAMLQTKLKLWTVGAMLTVATVTGGGIVAVQGQQGPGPGSPGNKLLPPVKPNDPAPGNIPLPPVKPNDPAQPLPRYSDDFIRSQLDELNRLKADYVIMNQTLDKLSRDNAAMKTELDAKRAIWNDDRAEELTLIIEKAKLRIQAAGSTIQQFEKLSAGPGRVSQVEFAQAKVAALSAKADILEAEFAIKKAERELAALTTKMPTADAKPADNVALRKLREERLAEAEKVLKFFERLVQAGTMTNDELYFDAVNVRAEAQLALLPEKSAERIVALTEAVNELKRHEEKMKAAVAAGRNRESDYPRAKLARITAEIRLREAEAAMK